MSTHLKVIGLALTLVCANVFFFLFNDSTPIEQGASKTASGVSLKEEFPRQ